MKMKKLLSIIFLNLGMIYFLQAQNTLPHFFIKNTGQISDASIKGYIQLDGYTVGFKNNGFSYYFYEPVKTAENKNHSEWEDVDKIKIHQLAFTLPQGNWELKMITGKMNDTSPVYYLKAGRQQKMLQYEALNFIDKSTGAVIKFSVKKGQLKYDIVIPENYTKSTFELLTNTKVRLSQGKLIYTIGQTFSLEEHFPAVYLTTEQGNRPVDIDITVTPSSIIYHLPKKRKNALVIDPIAYSLKYGTYYGGNNIDYIFKVRTDSKKNSVVFGYALSPDNIATAGTHQSTIASADYDMFVAKFDSLGNRLWGTYVGGTGPERTRAGAIDAHDNIIIAGNTTSSNGIATAGAHQASLYNSSDDACLIMLSPDGQLKWGTYYGGDGHEFINDIDYYNGKFYMTGHTESSVNMVSAGAHQTTFTGPSMAFLSIFDTTGTFIYGTYYGNGNNDYGKAIAISPAGDVYLVGQTQGATNIATAGTHQTTLAGAVDIFLSKWTSAGTLVWGTYYGGANRDLANSIAIHNNRVFITGFTESTSGIATPGAFQTSLNSFDDALLADFDAATGTLNEATYYGGNSTDYLSEIVFKDSLLYVFGYTSSTDFYTTNDAFQNTFNGGFDNVFVAFDTVCNPVSSSYYGGSGNENGHSIAVIDNYHFAVAGYTEPTDNLITPDAHQPAYGGFYYDGFYSIICKPVALTYLNIADSVALCQGATINLQSLNTFPVYTWNTGATTSSITVADTGKYWLETQDIHNCKGTSDTVYVYEIQVNRNISVSQNVLCAGDTSLLALDSSYSNYLWNTNVMNDSMYIDTTGSYYATFTDSAGCLHYSDTVNIIAIPATYNLSYLGNLNVCLGDTVVLYWADSNALQSIFWNNIQTTFSISPTAGGSYYASAVDTNGCSIQSDTLAVQFINLPPPTLTSSPGGIYSLCPGDTLNFQADTGYESYYWNIGATTSEISVFLPGMYYVTVTDSNGCSVTSDTAYVMASGIKNVAVTLTGISPSCFQDTVYLISEPNLTSVLWNNGAVTDSLLVTNTAYYFYSGQDIYGCTFYSDTVYFEVFPEIVDSIQLNDLPPYCDVQSVSMQLYHPQYFNTISWNTGDTVNVINVTASGDYYAQMVDTNGCTAYSDTVNIQVLQSVQPQLTYNPAKDTLCKDEILFVSFNNSINFNSWQWNNGAITDTTSYQAAVLGMLIVQLNATDSNGCVVQYSDTFVVSVCDGIEELSQFGIKLYPNPATDNFYIEANTMISYLAIHSIDGKLIRAWSNERFFNKNIDVQDLPKGMYFVIIEINKQVYAVKVMKE